MKFDRIEIEGFGRLRALDTGPSPLGSLIVVLGPNEAGKSTLFTFLTTALYGFHPATGERNPHVPWSAEDAAGRVWIRLDGGSCAEVERRLRAQPSARLTVDASSSDIRNQPLPWVEHVPRTVFRQVFALTLADLANLDSETWARIQDKVVGTMGASDLRSARAVAEGLEREAGEIWRPTRRGNQRLRDLQTRGRDLRARRSAAQERDARIRLLVDERERLLESLRVAREQRQRDRLALERAQSLLPLRQRLERIEALRRQGGDRSALRDLPADPSGRLNELEEERARLLKRVGALDAALAERRGDLEAFGGRERALLAAREDVARLVTRAAASGSERARAGELERELATTEEELDAVAAVLLERPWREVPASSIEAVSVDLLRDRIAQERVRRPLAAAAPADASPAWVGPAALAIGLVGLVAGAVARILTLTAVGAALAAFGLTRLLGARTVRAPRKPAPVSPQETAAEEVRELVAHLPVKPQQVNPPSDALPGAIARMQSLLRDRADRSGALETLRARLATVDRDTRRLAVDLGLDEPEASAELLAARLDTAVRDAERARMAADAAEREVRKLTEERSAVQRALSALAPEIEALGAAGRALEPRDPMVGLRAARERLDAHRRADELREELERVHPDLAELEQRLAAERGNPGSWTLDDEQLALTRARLEALEEEIERLVKQAESLARDVEYLRERETVDSVDSEIVSLREEEAALVRLRDRKWVIAKLLREADRRFREEHQPDLLRRASSYLQHLTGGRYSRLVVDEREGADLFQVVGPGLPAPVPLAPPVSTGTLEQAYLSLRLAIVDHLDQGGERLPLFIDEVFVNWDRTRRSLGLEVVASVARTRQVFVFTCHESLARDLETRGARVLALTAD